MYFILSAYDFFMIFNFFIDGMKGRLTLLHIPLKIFKCKHKTRPFIIFLCLSLQNCQHNTYGEHCEFCQIGYFGDARTASPNSCKKCACPLTLTSNKWVEQTL